MALLKWMHLRRLVPLTELLAGGAARPAPPRAEPAPAAAPPAARAPRPPAGQRPRARQRPAAAAQRAAEPPAAQPPAPRGRAGPHRAPRQPSRGRRATRPAKRTRRPPFWRRSSAPSGSSTARSSRRPSASTLVDDRLVFAFNAGQQRTLAAQVAQGRGWLESLASKGGRAQGGRSPPSRGDTVPEPAAGPASGPPPVESQHELKMAALDDDVVQALLEVFPAEIRDIEKIDP